MDQEEAISELLREHGITDANLTVAPIGANCYEVQPIDSLQIKATSTNEAPTIRDFQSLVGSLLWVARCTKPDIALTVHKTTRQTHQPRLHDWNLAKRVARYLKGTKTIKINMKPRDVRCSSTKLESFSDADFAADKSDRKSLTGGIILPNGMAISWSAKK